MKPRPPSPPAKPRKAKPKGITISASWGRDKRGRSVCTAVHVNGETFVPKLVPLVEPTEEELTQIKNSVHAVAGHVLTTDAARWLWALGARPQGGSK